jgi:glycosyltransferase involved in cell wall biosynthesis
VGVSIKISVLICTYNRALTLKNTIESLVVQTLPESVNWEILAVDNNSSDGTRLAVEDLQRRYPERIRYIFEPQQGVSFARNTGIRESRGEIVAFIDDDETAEDGWLQNLTANLYSGEWAGAGGRVLQPTTFLRPRWMLSNDPFTNGPLATFDKGLEAGKLYEPPFGANMAFRKEIFERYGGFRTDLGRSGEGMLSNEDTEFGRRLFAAGQRMRYEPAALTFHPVEANRLNKGYFLTWWFTKGRSDIKELGLQPNHKILFGMPFRMLYDITVEVVRWIVTPTPSKRFVSKMKVWAYAGQSFEQFHQWKETKRKGSVNSSKSQPRIQIGE